MANCGNWPVGFDPLIDIGQSGYQGFAGGKYPFGNHRPPAYEARGVDFAAHVLPLDANGDINPADGKIVLAILGTSATNIIAPHFTAAVAERQPDAVNPQLVIVNLAKDGKTIDEIADPNDGYWQNWIPNKLAAAGITSAQVQCVWMQSGERDPPTPFPAHALTSKGYWTAAVANAKATLPNLRMAWLSPPLFEGYAQPPLAVPEPAYGEQGFAVKWAIEDYINGFMPAVPFLSYGFYPWAGPTPRSDGFSWPCPASVQADGRHPSAAGADAIASAMLVEFLRDPCAAGWFSKMSAQT